MDFFASQELARRNTRKLIVLLIFTMVCLIGSIYCLVIVAGGFVDRGEDGTFHWLNLPVLGIVSVVVTAVVGAGSLIKVTELRAGGPKVAAMLGGRRLLPGSRDATERRILNIVEEMAIASGMPVPPVYVLDEEPGINAFAAGYTLDDAVIGLNRGTIETLSRDELQGVVAHEFSHILNGDMRMSLRLIGILHGIQAIALIGWVILRSVGSGARYRSRNSKDGGGQVAILAIGAGLLVLGSIGLFFARLIKASVSRQREFLADASSVQFTRNPGAISDALKMIGAHQSHSVVQNGEAEEISHMFFARMNGSLLSGLFSTHPPLINRIRQIEPRFDGDYVEWYKARMPRLAAGKKENEKGEAEEKERLNLLSGVFAGDGGSFILNPIMVIGAIGQPTDDDLVFSKMLIGNIPSKLLDAIRETFLARCVVFASLLERASGDLRNQQLSYLKNHEGQPTVDETLRLEELVDSFGRRWRIPVFEIIQGTLAGLSPVQFERFRASVIWMVESDGRVSLFEFFLQHHLLTHLDRKFGKLQLSKTRYESIGEVAQAASILMDMLVRQGSMAADSAGRSGSNDTQEAIWKTGLTQIPAEFHDRFQRPRQAANIRELNEAIDTIGLASPAVKKQFLSAAAIIMGADRKILAVEAELFRALAESLDCPVPPLLASEESGIRSVE